MPSSSSLPRVWAFRDFAVGLMRVCMPGWSKMATMAHTLRYDLTILGGTQTGRPLPNGRWTANTPTLVAVGSRSEAFFHHGARALAGILPSGNYHSLEGGDHSAVLLAPKALAAAAESFFASGERSALNVELGSGAGGKRPGSGDVLQ